MSHTKEREEKICLNCNAALNGRYCHACGQENTAPKETVWGLISHFFNDITHFDGKFFSTVKYLIAKPGFLSAEYIKGRRASYLHPIRMYVFTSAFFFIIFFSLFNPEKMIKGEQSNAEKLDELTTASASLKQRLPATTDSDLKTAMLHSINHIDAHVAWLQKAVSAQARKDSAKTANTNVILDSAGIKIRGNKYITQEDTVDLNKQIHSKNSGLNSVLFDEYTSRIAYDSVQNELPPARRDGWFIREMIHKHIIYNTKYKNDHKEAGVLLTEKIMHTLPQALFVSLPVFALILLMLYFRRDVYYVDHGIFTIHLYCAGFILLLVYFGIDRIQSATGLDWLGWLKAIMVIGLFFYLYKAMRGFYRQGRFKTLLKFVILNCFFFAFVIVLIFAFTFLSVMQFS